MGAGKWFGTQWRIRILTQLCFPKLETVVIASPRFTPLPFMATQVISVRCQNCGSPLQVNDTIRFLTCNYCKSELELVRDASTVHTEVLQRIEQNTETTVSQLKVIELQNEIERLDREWEMWRQANLGRNKDGSLREPSTVGSIVGGLFVAGFGIFWTITAASFDRAGVFPASRIFPFFGVCFVIFGLFTCFRESQKAGEYPAARSRYENERGRLQQQLEALRRQA